MKNTVILALILAFSFQALANGTLQSLSKEILADKEVAKKLNKLQKLPRRYEPICTGVIRRYGADELKIPGIARWLQTHQRSHFNPLLEMKAETSDYTLKTVFNPRDSEENHASPTLIAFVEDMAAHAKTISGQPLFITSLTTNPNKENYDRHCNHRGGYGIDFRPLPGDKPLTPRAAGYSLKMNKAFLMVLVKDERVKRIQYNDVRLMAKDEEIQKAKDARRNPIDLLYKRGGGKHSTHYHIELHMPDKLQMLSEYIVQDLKQMDFQEPRKVATNKPLARRYKRRPS